MVIPTESWFKISAIKRQGKKHTLYFDAFSIEFISSPKNGQLRTSELEDII